MQKVLQFGVLLKAFRGMSRARHQREKVQGDCLQRMGEGASVERMDYSTKGQHPHGVFGTPGFVLSLARRSWVVLQIMKAARL